MLAYPWFVVGPENLVCKLKKSLYGLKQAPRAWRYKRNEIMDKLGFKPALADTCTYIKVTRNGKILVNQELGNYFNQKGINFMPWLDRDTFTEI
jgi:hypothetical protein